MTTDDFIAEQNAIEDALDADRDPFAGDDPDEDYLQAEADRRTAFHEERAHGGQSCDCPEAPAASGEAPF